MKRVKIIPLSLIIVVLLLIITNNMVYAVTSTWSGTVGGVHVSAEKEILTSAYVWKTWLTSQAVQNINIIGYTYWTMGTWCPGGNPAYWADWHQYGGAYHTNSSIYTDVATLYYYTCNGSGNVLRSLGNHDFAYGSGHVYPSVSVSLNR
jgi:hypothetical protein